MGETSALWWLLGAACGVLAALPAARFLRRARRGGSRLSLGRAAASVIVPALVLELLVVAATAWRRELALPVGTSSALAFLVSVLLAALLPGRCR